MGVYHPFSVICPHCDGRYVAYLVNSVNATRFPRLKAKVLSRELNTSRCPSCGYLAYVEKPFFYTDVANHLNITVYPRKERHFHRRAADETNRLFSAFNHTRVADIKAKRVVFGLEELREKVVANEAGISDQELEFLKLYLLKEHPFVLQKKRMRVTLNQVTREKFEFNATFDHDRDYFNLYIPRAFYEALVLQPKAQKPLQRTFGDDGKAAWVNLWKLNPQNEALNALSTFAEAIRANKPVDVDGNIFTKMLKTLPSGNQLPSWAKRDLQTISDLAEKINRPKIVERVFEIRFGFELDDDWFKNSDDNDVKILWKLLKDLPDIAVEGNSWIRAIYVDKKDKDGGAYDPSSKEISIGSGLHSGTSEFRNVILHEVGHSVQEKLDREKAKLILKWLEREFGWLELAPTAKGIDQWIALMGGYPAGTPNKVKIGVRSYIQQSLGPGETFDRAAIVHGPIGHLWNKLDFPPRKAFSLTKGSWWETCDTFYQHGNRCFFVNYYYGTLMVVNKAAIDLISGHMPDRYAAMSHYEFFAELFAWYYDGRSRNRDAIPRRAGAWLVRHIGHLDLSAPFGSHRPPRRRRMAVPSRRRPARQRH